MEVSIQTLIISLVVLSIVTYLVSRLSYKLGSILTTIISFLAFSVIAYAGYVEPSILQQNAILLESIYPNISVFEITDLAIFFTVILTFIYAMASFFNPYFIETIKYKHAYNFAWVLSIAGVIGVFFASNILVFFLLI